MTHEEMLSKDDALIELTKAIQKLPITTLTMVIDGRQQIVTLVDRLAVLQLIPRFGFNDEPYRPSRPAWHFLRERAEAGSRSPQPPQD